MSDGTCVVTAKGDDNITGDFSVLIPADSLGWPSCVWTRMHLG